MGQEEIIIDKRNCIWPFHKWIWECNVKIINKYTYGETSYCKARFRCLICGKTKLSFLRYYD